MVILAGVVDYDDMAWVPDLGLGAEGMGGGRDRLNRRHIIVLLEL